MISITFTGTKKRVLFTVWFNDYNEEVLKHITMPNTLLNVPKEPAKTRHGWKEERIFMQTVSQVLRRRLGIF